MLDSIRSTCFGLLVVAKVGWESLVMDLIIGLDFGLFDEAVEIRLVANGMHKVDVLALCFGDLGISFLKGIRFSCLKVLGIHFTKDHKDHWVDCSFL